MQIKIKGRPITVDLVRPKSFTERLDVQVAVRANPHRGIGCALGLCWMRARKRTPYRGDPIAFGGEILDQLDAEGADFADVMEAGTAALALCLEQIVSEAEVSAAEGNSGAPADSSI